MATVYVFAYSGHVGSYTKRHPLVLVLLTAAVAAAGCTAPPMRYSLRGTGAFTLLVPPSPPGNGRPRTLNVSLRGAQPCGTLNASWSNPALGLSWSVARRRLEVTLWPSITRIPSSGMPLPLLDGIQQLRAALDDAVTRGCLPQLAEAKALRQIVESAPMSPAVAQQIVYGPYAAQQFIDIGRGTGLAFSYALDPAHPDRYDLGYVEQAFRFQAKASDGRGRLVPTPARVLAAPAHSRPAPSPPVAIPTAGPAFFRLFFYLRDSHSDHNVALLRATTRPDLDSATQFLLAAPGRCSRLPQASTTCLLIPSDVGLEARILVRVGGHEVGVPLPATVKQALQAAGFYDLQRLDTLRVWRPYHGREIQVSATGTPALLDFVLSGGERIQPDWSPQG